jgi:hypothetical protein
MFDGGWSTRPFFGNPFMVEPHFDVVEEASKAGPHRVGRTRISTVHHELTHLACARATRLGLVLGTAAARAMEQFRLGQPIIIPRGVESILGALTPILEGLALYAELDFESDEKNAILPNPVTQHAQLVSWEQTMLQVFHLALDQAVIESEDLAEPGLLRLLFLDDANPDRSFYLVGYLWIKAVAAQIARRCPSLAPPYRMLPFLSRLLCHHTIITDAYEGKCDAAAIVNALHTCVSDLDRPTLNKLAKMITDHPDTLKKFDHWNIQAQVASGRYLRFTTMTKAEVHQFIGKLLNDNSLSHYLTIMRSAANVHLLSQTTGVVQAVDIKKRTAVLVPEVGTTAGSQKEIKLLPIREFWTWASKAASSSDREIIARYIDHASQFETEIMQLLAKAIGHSVTLAAYMTLIHPLSYGIIAWFNDGPPQRPVFLPLTWTTWEEKKEDELNQYALRYAIGISVKRRLDFSSSLEMSSHLIDARQLATNVLLSKLVGCPRMRYRLIARRLLGVAPPETHAEIAKWVSVSRLRQSAWQLSDRVVGRLGEALDFPGFRGPQGRLTFSMRALFPLIPPNLGSAAYQRRS